MDKKAKFSKLLSELKKWNDHTNLTAIRDDAGIEKKHFLDSLSVIPNIPKEAKTLVDVGTGAGFPGLPIAIECPELAVTLIETSEKKVLFLKHVVAELELHNVTIVNSRAEDAGKNPEFREKFDVAVARAVAGLPTLSEYLLPLVRVGGMMIAQKSINEEEISNSTNALKILGGAKPVLVPIKIDGLAPRQLVIVTKEKPTPIEYPRRSGIPLRKPL